MFLAPLYEARSSVFAFLIFLMFILSSLDLNKIKTAISISKWIKLKLGDTFRVVVYHNERHIKQANKILDKKSPRTT